VTSGPTISQIQAQVTAIRAKAQSAQIIALRARGRWEGEQVGGDGAEPLAIFQCDSPLEMRLAIRAEAPEAALKVLLTDLPDEQIGEDIRLRLAKRRVFPLDSWSIVKDLFQARHIDPRVVQQPWMAARLLELLPPGRYPASPGGVLDAETVWALLLERQVGLAAERPDLMSVLKWATEAQSAARWRDAPGEFRAAASAWLSESAGSIACLILRSLEVTGEPLAVPLGLALAVLHSEAPEVPLEKACGKLEERYLGGAAIDAKGARRWAEAARALLRVQFPEVRSRRAWLEQADDVLRALAADPYAYLSDSTPLGFEQRLGRFGEALAAALERRDFGGDELGGRQAAVLRHDLAFENPRRTERVEMAARLLRWVGTRAGKPPAPASFAEAARAYAQEGAFADWARSVLLGGEPARALASAYSRLLAEVRAVREEENREFALLLRDWLAAGAGTGAVLPVERFLEEVVSPLAREAPVLLLVIDGMSQAVFRELLEDILREDWVELGKEGAESAPPLIAAVPSVTAVCRTSLLSGKLSLGNQSDEASGFASHPGLAALSRAGEAPVLFHKASLQEGSHPDLASEVRAAIASRRRIVGVVINAVDDHLAKGEQLDIRWTKEEIKALPVLLYEAKAAGRVVILLSDHGHVIEEGTEQAPGIEGERWRAGDGRPGPLELQVAGPRVLLSGGRVIAPWSERLRYGGRKNGYHGGLTPQEMVIPLAVLSAREAPAGWVEAPGTCPEWWEAAAMATAAKIEVAPRREPPKPKKGQLEFDFTAPAVGDPEKPAMREKAAAPEGWLGALLGSPVYKEQKKLAGRKLPSDAEVSRFLELLAIQGGKLTAAALSHKLALPPFRLAGLLAVLQRLLNVEGYPVLVREEASGTVELNLDLLLRQFDLKAEP
jgi:hypothetical protein